MSTISTGREASVAVEIGGREITFETGKLAKQADGAVVVRCGRHDDPRHGRRPHQREAGRGLLPADRRRRRADVCRREDPGRLLQARGSRHRARHADRSDDRPPDPAAVAEGLQERDPGDLHRPVGRHGRAARHPRDQRRLRGARDLAAAVSRAGRRSSHRDRRRRAHAQPDLRGDGCESGSRPDRRRDARGAHHDRGRRRPGAGRDDARRVRARTPGDHPHLRRDRRARSARSGSRSGSTSSSTPTSRLSTAMPCGSGSSRSGFATRKESSTSCSRLPRRRSRSTSTEDDIVRELQVRNGLQMLLEKQRLAAIQGPLPGAVRERASLAHRGRAGLQGAQVAQARHPPRSGPGRRAARVPGSAERRRAATV